MSVRSSVIDVSYLVIGVNFAFVLTPKSDVKSSKQTRRIFSTITKSLDILIEKSLPDLMIIVNEYLA